MGEGAKINRRLEMLCLSYFILFFSKEKFTFIFTPSHPPKKLCRRLRFLCPYRSFIYLCVQWRLFKIYPIYIEKQYTMYQRKKYHISNKESGVARIPLTFIPTSKEAFWQAPIIMIQVWCPPFLRKYACTFLF